MGEVLVMAPFNTLSSSTKNRVQSRNSSSLFIMFSGAILQYNDHEHIIQFSKYEVYLRDVT